jgi:hypothetical protein
MNFGRTNNSSLFHSTFDFVACQSSACGRRIAGFAPEARA